MSALPRDEALPQTKPRPLTTAGVPFSARSYPNERAPRLAARDDDDLSARLLVRKAHFSLVGNNDLDEFCAAME